MKTYRLSSDLSLIDIAPAMAGFERFLGIYLLETGKIALFDAGPAVGVENLISGLKEVGVDPADVSYILLTHIHMDHAGGVGKALEHMPRAKVVVHGRGAPHMVDPTRLWEDSQRALGQMARDYGPITPVPEDRIVIGKDGMLIDLDGVELEVLETPGHAPHHLSFWDKKGGRLFAGEAAGVYNDVAGYVRPSAPPPFHIEQGVKSVDRLIGLKPETLYYAHFGGVDRALDKLKSYRPQLVMWVKTVADCLEKGDNEAKIYATIRGKDPSLALIDELPAGQRDRETYFVENTIAGFVAYFQRFGSDYVKQL